MEYFLMGLVFLILLLTMLQTRKRSFMLILYWVYLGCLLFMLFRNGDYSFDMGKILSRIKTLDHINLIPFETIRLYWNNVSNVGIGNFLINILGNTILFVPLGFLTSLLYKEHRKILNAILRAICFPAIIEILQLFIYRSVDIDDVILNSLGIFTGYLLFMISSLFSKTLRYNFISNKEEQNY